ncbi:MAG TPA: hypothetical protein VHL81_00745 [Gemmatimonadales bacterium]|jgi:hypothetical protein|nr:hypothetical protein [Gemmatimonadales bacterium]
MTSLRHVWLVCGLAVLVLDTLGSLAARHWGFAYGTLSAVSFIIYFCAGVGGGRLSGVWAGGIAGGITALIDATLGWAISSSLGAMGRPGPALTPLSITLVGLGVVFTGWSLGLLGGVIGRVVHRSLAADPSAAGAADKRL